MLVCIYSHLFSLFPKMAKGKYSRKRRSNFATKVKRVLARQVEHKSFLVSGGFTSVDSTGDVLHLTAITQGDGDSNRDGDQVHLSKIEMRGMVTVADTTNKLRLVVFRWNGDKTPEIGDIIRNYSAGGADLDFIRPYNHDHRGNFKILYDKWWHLNSNSAELVLNDIPFRFIRYGDRLGAKKIYYENATDTPLKGGVWALAFSDSGAVANPAVTYEFEAIYTDM